MSAGEWSGKGWEVTVGDAQVTVEREAGQVTSEGADVGRLQVRRRWLRWCLERDDELLVRLAGITTAEASTLAQAIGHLALTPAIAAAASWRHAVTRVLSQARAEQRWIPVEAVDLLLSTRPEARLIDRVRAVGCEPLLTEEELISVGLLDTDLGSLVGETNEQIMAAELFSMRPFLETIEKSPLTDEQARAVVCFDNRVLLLAAAGSGKTSVMVGRAAYAVSRGFVPPDRILLLAFNKQAAIELQERVSARFAAAGIDCTGLRASTFHSFGLDVIGRATGKKPRLAPWLDQGEDVRMVLQIVDELRDASPQFRYRWDLYRMLFANAPTDLDEHAPDGYRKDRRETGYRTLGGQVVKSHGERLIADFLFLNGVDYVYERSYDVEVADATHSQYRPDFYYPGIGVWHEHWALDREGQPPAAFQGYAEAMAWKRRVHAEHGTRLIESKWSDVVFGNGLSNLKDELTSLGLSFDWNPDRPVSGEWVKSLRHEDLARLIRTFMAHVKSSSSTADDLERRLASYLAHLDGYRTRLFLDLYWQIHAGWERRLAADRSLDFEDMPVQAAEHIEGGDVELPYDLIMVDEFQDASRARARLVRGLLKAPGRYLLAVGDDWQSINRFAGADLSVMRNFEAWFGRGPQLALTRTFRCTQAICDVASTFVARNPNQFQKAMRSANREPGASVTVIRAENVAGALASYLERLSASLAEGSIPRDGSRPVSVDVLGRYGFERDLLPRSVPSNLKVTFRTVHGSKGLEADYVVVPGMSTGTYGFPSNVADDPVLDLAMPAPEAFAHAEERRLFYVALTRARRAVTLITSPKQMSPFVVELLADPNVTVAGAVDAPVEICPKCRQGTMVERKGRYGVFLGCSSFPACTNTRPLQPPGPGRGSTQPLA